jgi:S-DNA-T family DNA segregation ATPase FtsK/SpoIIIE
MTTPNEHMPGTPDDGLPGAAELQAWVFGPDAVGANRLDQGSALVQQEGDDDALTGEVIDPPAPPTAEPERSAGQVIEQRPEPPRVTARPVLPAFWKSPAEFSRTLRWVLLDKYNRAAFHAVRVPVYAWRLTARSPRGLWRLLSSSSRWASDREHTTARLAVLGATRDPAAYLKVKTEHRRLVARRWWMLAFAAGGAVFAAYVLSEALVPLYQYAALTLVVLALGVLGTDSAKPVVEEATGKENIPPLTSDLITTALAKINVKAINDAINEEEARLTRAAKRGPHRIEVDVDGIRTEARRRAIAILGMVREGEGFRTDIDLPAGATAADVVAQRSELASALRRELACVWPEPMPRRHTGRLILYVADEPMTPENAPKWSLAETGTVNLFEPFPFGADQRGRPVSTSIMFASGVIGAVPRMGKTFAMRLVALAAALDVRTEIHVHDFKGGGDWRTLKTVAHYFRLGDSPDDHTALATNLRYLKTEQDRRYDLLRELDEDICPDSKVTDTLSSRRDLRLHPIAVFFDETQIMFEHENGNWYASIVTDLIKRGPAAGIMVFLGTQRVDADSIPKAISSNAVWRLCLKVLGHTENNMVLGSSAYKVGIRATTFEFEDKGLAYLIDNGPARIVRVANVDAPTAKAIAKRAHAARVAAGRLTGMAAGEIPADTTTGSVLDHLAACWPAEDGNPAAKVYGEDLAAALAAYMPDIYEGYTPARLTAAVKPHGLGSVQVNRGGKNRRGLAWDDVATALGLKAATETPTDARTDKED